MINDKAIGIMDPAYFTPRNQLLAWINSLLQLEISHIEDLGTGAVYCQLLDAAFPGALPLSKVSWKAKFQYEFVGNLKIFQQALEKLGVSKKVEIQKLSKAKYQDNLQMIQWLKRYIQINGKDDMSGYDAITRRGGASFYQLSNAKKSFNPNASKVFTNASKVFTPRGQSARGQFNKTVRLTERNKQNKQKHGDHQQMTPADCKIAKIKGIIQSKGNNLESKLKEIETLINQGKTEMEEEVF